MSFKIIRASQPLQPRPLFTAIYGPPGVGKTTLSFTMPGPALHFDFDQGIDRAVQQYRPDYVQMESFEDVFNYVMSTQFEKDVKEYGYKTAILDTIGTLLDNFAAPYLIAKNPKNGNGSGGLGLSGWGNLGILFNQFLNRFRSLGLEATEFKTTGRAKKLEDYRKTVQWKMYLLCNPELLAINYRVYQLNKDNTQCKMSEFSFERYPEIENEVQALMDGFVSWLSFHPELMKKLEVLQDRSPFGSAI